MTTEFIVDDKHGKFGFVETNDKTGKKGDQEILTADKVLAPNAIGQVLLAQVKGVSTRRAAFGSFLGMIYGNSRLDVFRGQGDKTTGKMSAEFKGAVRDVESAVIDELIESGAIKVKKGDEAAKQAFLSTLRDDSNYSNAKNTTNRYFSFVGSNCVTKSGYVVPFEFMRKQIAAVMERPAPDNTLNRRLMEAADFLAKNEAIEADDVGASIITLSSMLTTLQGIASHYSELATRAREGVDAAATKVIQGARTRAPAEKPAAAKKEATQ